MIYEQNRPQDFIYLEVNSAFEGLTGLKNVVGRKVTEVIPGIKESNPELFEIYGRVALTGKPERLEIYLEPLRAWLSISVYSVEKEYFVAVFDNITERKRIEDELKHSREWFSTVFEATRDGIVVEEDEKIAYANLSFAKLFRYDSPAELVGKPISLLNSPADNARLLEYGRKRLKGETVPSQYEFTGKRKDGSLAELEASISIVTISGKQYIISGIRDISERKQTEEQLRKLFRAVEFSPSSIVITDIEGRIEYVNPKFTRVSGYAPAEVMGKNPRVLKSGETGSEEYKKLWETILAGKEWSGEFHNKRKNGELFWESVSISPITDLDGKVTHFIAMKEDITEKKHLQQIAKRMEQLAALGQLSASIAHEIRNPLAAISLNIQMLSDGLKIPDDYREMVDDINIGIQRIQNIIKDILNFARPVQPTLTTEDIQKVIEIGLHSVINDMEKGQITIIREYEPIPFKVKIDINQINEVLINLFINARQAMNLGGKLTVRTQMQNHNVIVEVEDTGGGISPQNLEKVFSPFFTTKPRGTGLGLAIVYRIIENHHAQIFVESKEGVGTRFRLQFPLS
jgi:PAS domain S-box-containing protein